MAEILDLSDWEFKITMINMLQTPKGKSGQHEITDGWCEHRDRNYEKNQKKILGNQKQGNKWKTLLMGSPLD